MHFFAYTHCLLFSVMILTTTALPVGLQKILSGNNYQVVLGPKEFVSKYNQNGDGVIVPVSPNSPSNSEYVIYGKIFVLKKKGSANLENQNEETNIVVPNSPSDNYKFQYSFQETKSGEIIDTESIVFPKDIQGHRFEYKPFDYESPTDDSTDYKASDTIMPILTSVESSSLNPLLKRRSGSDPQQQLTTAIKNNESRFKSERIIDQENASTANVEDVKQVESLGSISIQTLEKWADAYKTLESSALEIENNTQRAATNETDLSFQSLFIVPTLKNPQGGFVCPEGQRRNHAGVCVTPYVHRGDRDRTTSNGKSGTSSLKPIQSSIASLMESLRSVELQALQALLGSTSPTTTETIPGIELGNRHNFHTTGTTEKVSSDVSTTSTPSTPKPNHFRSILIPHQNNRNSELTVAPTTEKSLLEILKEYGKINFDFSQIQKKYNITRTRPS